MDNKAVWKMRYGLMIIANHYNYDVVAECEALRRLVKNQILIQK